LSTDPGGARQDGVVANIMKYLGTPDRVPGTEVQITIADRAGRLIV